MIEIDNKKMWESLLKHNEVGWISTLIKRSLKDQGFKVEDGEIVDIESNVPETDFGKDELTGIELSLYDWLSSDSCGQIDKDTMHSVCKKRAEELTAIFSKEHEAELERAYRNADEVQYQRGYEKGYKDAEKKISEAILQGFGYLYQKEE